MRPLALVLAVATFLAGVAGCGAATDSNSTATSTVKTTSGSATETAAERTTPASGPDASPGPTVRAFLDAYRADSRGRACSLVSSTFRNPRNRTLSPPKACSTGRKNDALAQGLIVVATKITGVKARVLAINVKRSQLLFSLARYPHGWRITGVKALPGRAGASPTIK